MGCCELAGRTGLTDTENLSASVLADVLMVFFVAP